MSVRGAAILTVVAAATLLLGVPAATASPSAEYVALGDSAAAGPLISPQDMRAPGCLRSTRNYPNVVAQRLGLRLVDVTCSSAKSADVALRGQRTLSGSTVPVQTSALSTRTKLVTVTIGANDIGLFPIALSCVSVPGAQPCSQQYRRGGVDRIAQTIARETPTWGATFDRIRAAAPNARVVVVGYGTYIRPSGCAIQPVRPADAVFLQQSLNRMNQALAEQARRRGMTYVDITKPTVGHDICAAPADAYYFGMVPSSVGVPLHPTALGMSAIGRHVAGVVG